MKHFLHGLSPACFGIHSYFSSSETDRPGNYLGRLRNRILTLGALLVISSVSHANLITNGSFETGNFAPQFPDAMALSVGATDITGWTVIASDPNATWHTIGWFGANNPYGIQSSLGNYSLDLTGWSDGAPFGGVTQAILTAPGQMYVLSFDLGSSSLWGRPSAILASAELTSQTFTSSSLLNGNSDWEHVMLTFTASSANTTISLIGATGNAYIGLDNVVIEAVPLPSALWLFGSGLLGLIGSAWKLKRPE